MVATKKLRSSAPDFDTETVIESKWCEEHDIAFAEADRAGAPRYIAETLCIHAVFENQLEKTSGCWACPLTTLEFGRLLSKAAVIDAEARQNGGTYTTNELHLTLGSVE